MGAVMEPVILGALILFLGISNMKGNISSVHWYHRKRVTEENLLPFGKTIGLGTAVCGGALMASGLFTFASQKTQLAVLATAGNVVMVAGIVVGLGITLYAMIKYNKGIF